MQISVPYLYFGAMVYEEERDEDRDKPYLRIRVYLYLFVDALAFLFFLLILLSLSLADLSEKRKMECGACPLNVSRSHLCYYELMVSARKYLPESHRLRIRPWIRSGIVSF